MRVYVSLPYDQYKAFEGQFEQGCKPLETQHNTEDKRYYHKVITIKIGDVTFEVIGPPVMAPEGQSTLPSQEDE